LTAACRTLEKNCVRGISANRARLRAMVEQSIGLVTALNPYIGYENATSVAQEALQTGQGVLEIVLARQLMRESDLQMVLRPENLTQPAELLPIKPPPRP